MTLRGHLGKERVFGFSGLRVSHESNIFPIDNIIMFTKVYNIPSLTPILNNGFLCPSVIGKS